MNSVNQLLLTSRQAAAALSNSNPGCGETATGAESGGKGQPAGAATATSERHGGAAMSTNLAVTRGPKLTRTTFHTSREMDFFSAKELVTQTGHSLGEWPLDGLAFRFDMSVHPWRGGGEDIQTPPR